MSNAAIHYLRLLRKIVRDSARRLGGAEETFLVAGFSAAAGDLARRATSCGHSREQAHQTREPT